MAYFIGSGPSVHEIHKECIIKRELTTSLKKATHQLQKSYVSVSEPIYSGDVANTICDVLEAIFLHCCKPSMSNKVSGLLGKSIEPSEMHFWDYISLFSHHDVVSQLNHLARITTRIGMCRAWIRLALNDGLMESYLATMFRDENTLRAYYKRTAYLRDVEQNTIMLSCIQGLSAFRFDLSYNCSELNLWTTTQLTLAGLVVPKAEVALPVSKAEEALPENIDRSDAENSVVSRSTRSRVIDNISYTDPSIVQPPPNTPLDSLFRHDASGMEQMRRLMDATKQQQQQSGGELSSTATSQVSCPDSSDDREYPQLNLTAKSLQIDKEFGAIASDNGRTGRGTGVDANMTTVPDIIHTKVKAKQKRKRQSKTKKTVDSSHQQAIAPASITDQPVNCLANTIDKPVGGSASATDQPVSGSASATNQPVTDADVHVGVSPRSSPVADTYLVTTSVENDDTKPSDHKPPIPIDDDNVQAQVSDDRASSSNCNVNGATNEVSDDAQAESEEELHSIYSSERVIPQRPAAGRQPEAVVSAGSSVSSQPTCDAGIAGLEVATEAEVAFRDVDRVADTLEAVDDVTIERPRDHARLAAPRGNALGQVMLQGWSSEFDNEPNLYDSVYTDSHESDYTSAPLGGIRPNDLPVIGRLKAVHDRVIASLSDPSESTSQLSTQGAGSFEDYEILTEDEASFEEARHEAFKEKYCEIQHEKGLDFHNFQCNGCKRQVGLFFCNPRVCCYDGCYYCYECHENNEYYIPAKILQNWDFQKYPVGQANLVLLQQFADVHLVNIDVVNPRLYDHVKEMQEAKLLRTQLRFLKAYMFTCKQTVADAFRNQVMPKEYLYDDIHQYSLLDLLQVASGQFAVSLQKLIRDAARHIYDCRLCSVKGFICEICNSPKVIYPFELELTYRCASCESVYHKACKSPSVECPKCKRLIERRMKLGKMASTLTDNDYACGAST